ncbi:MULTISPECIES: 30S ribosome-binding factor RbfA [Reichenbachiella]|uniref:30S ribosome-binding factor RbfA n=1 Tax=Reichenbachiella TaxID=156993 RepID=UPI000E6C4850|nr:MULTISPECIES: 30S ribosome-binding factor RbfA [Reichenbachiella]MBU2914287.1 30S ribosome-binding factor RbfA [Reichenbachiella agariperforans]RJE73014.1 ribosome-binding factor A [Reichenbachiella sp. MSK19-1]
MSSTRQLKYAGLIQKDLSEIFQKDSRHWFGNAFITVTEVNVSPDLSFAKVFISLMMIDDREAFIEKMAEKKPEIRKALGLKIGKQVRIVPELHFVLDESQDHAQKMDNILSRLNIPKEDKGESEE